MHATMRKRGNSLAPRLPKALANEVHLAEGGQVELVRTEAGLLVKPTRQWRYALAELVAGITPKNAHPETDWGSSVGREAAK